MNENGLKITLMGELHFRQFLRFSNYRERKSGM